MDTCTVPEAAEEVGESGFRGRKRARDEVDVRRAAEIVLVLAAMGRMRGGRVPTEAEREMMAEARAEVARACEGFAPRDVFPGDAFEAVIEDIGLSQVKEQRVGFRAPKMSIGEKYLFTKHKRLLTSPNAAVESHEPLPPIRTSVLDKPSCPKISGGLQPAVTISHGSVGNFASLPYQLPASEVRTSSLSSGLPSNGRDSSTEAVRRVDRPHFRPEPALNGSSYSLPVKVNPSGIQVVQKPPAPSQQVQAGLSGKSVPDNKVLLHPTVKVAGHAVRTPTMAPQASKPVHTQPTFGTVQTMHQHTRGINISQGPLLRNPHIEISIIVQKLLQALGPGNATWSPPSRDYVNKPLPCQVCMVKISGVENILVCDACERGYHLKCLESLNKKGASKGEWYCFKCLSLSNGKALPPKYGRVSRNTGAPKVQADTAAVQPAQTKKLEKSSENGNQPKLSANGSAELQSPSVSIGNNHSNPGTVSNAPNGRETQGSDILCSRETVADKRPAKDGPEDASRSTGPACTSVSAGLFVEASHEVERVFEIKGSSPVKSSETSSETTDHLQASSNFLNKDQELHPDESGVPLIQCDGDKVNVEASEESRSVKTCDENLNGVTKEVEQVVVTDEPNYHSGTRILESKYSRPPWEVSDNVDWIGDVLQVVDQKIYYLSCCVDGVVYKVQDHALLYSSNKKLIPYKLQAMWEDRKSRSKWVIANRCFSHDDLPEIVGRPCTPESNEVCESNHGITIMAGLIKGPCEVLPPGKYIEESQRRSRMGSRENDGLRPLFLCKWFFDELKGVFRDVSS